MIVLQTSVFTPVLGSSTSVMTDSTMTSDTVIKTLLDKFKVSTLLVLGPVWSKFDPGIAEKSLQVFPFLHTNTTGFVLLTKLLYLCCCPLLMTASAFVCEETFCLASVFEHTCFIL